MYRLILLAICFSATLFYGCKQNETLVSVDPKYKKWVAGYTYGVISNRDNITIELRNEMDSSIAEENELKSNMDNKILNEILEISPAIEGKASWTDERTITFEPANPLPSGQLYTVSVDLEKVAKVESGYEEFVFQFATIPQKIEVDNIAALEYDSYNTEWYYVEGNISLSDDCDTSKLKEVLKAKYQNKSVPITINEGYDASSYSFRIDSLKRGQKSRMLKLSWDGEAINSASRGSEQIEIASIHDFSLVSFDVKNDKEQSVVLTFSEALQVNQDLKGLIDIECIDGETFSVYYNQVTVYLPHNIEGTKTLHIHSGIRNHKGTKAENPETKRITFMLPGPQIRMIGEGCILPDSKGLIFPFESLGLKSVTVRIIKVYEDNIHHFLQVNDLDGSDAIFRFGKKVYEKNIDLNILKKDKANWTTNVLNLEHFIKPESGAIYRISLKFGRKDTYCDCPVETENSEESEQDEDWDEYTWHMDDWDNGYNSWGGYSNEDSPCSDSYYDGKAISTNILASNLGIIFKMDGFKTGHTFVTDMNTTNPISDVNVTFYDFQKQVVSSGNTDYQGMLQTTFSRKPFLMVAKHGKQRGYLKVSTMHSNSTSEFDVEGEANEAGIQGYIYAERGVWRPGDSIFINFILRDLENKLPANHPVTFKLMSESGVEVSTLTTTQSLNGHYLFKTATPVYAPTGSYTVTAIVGSREFTKSLRIETIKPNRLKIDLKLPKNAFADSNAMLKSRWLHGAPARALDAKVEVELHSQKTVINGFKDYVFDSPIKELSSMPTVLFDSKLDTEGKTDFACMIPNISNAPGILKATYTTRVFEKSGNYSIDRFTEDYSPYNHYVGIKIPEKEADNSLISGKKHPFSLVIADVNGKVCTEQKKLKVRIYRMEWRWWYEAGEDDFTDFISRNGNMVVYDSTIITSTGKSAFQFGIPEEQYGRFLITVTDERGQHQTGETIVIDQPYWSRGNQSNNSFASMLNFSTDKKVYQKGEEVKVSMPTASLGRALVSIESQKKILKKFWIETQKGETVFTFNTTAEMTPNVYIHISLLQPHSSTVNDLPIRMYGIMPIMVDDPETHLQPTIGTNKSWKPETTEKITVSEATGKAIVYTVAVVDDGLLDLTRFKTPNPWSKFYSKEALGVETWDMYDDVIGAFGGQLNKMISIGGDGAANDGAGPKANRFKPMVHFIGPFYLPAGGKQTHEIALPTYIGSVRVMIVAHNDDAFGSAESTVEIKKPLMILGTLPRVLGPTETIQLPIDVFAMEKNIKNVKVSVSTNEFLQIKGGNSQQLTFEEIGDELVNFELKVADKLGIAKIKILAECGTEKAVQEFEVDVRSANPIIRETTLKKLRPGESVNLEITADGYAGTHQFLLEASSFEPINFAQRMDELICYPHGCIEQTTSAVFPQLLAKDVMNLSMKDQERMTENINEALNRFRSFQNYQGGFAYWPGKNEESEWGTNFAGHFMIEAELRGYSVSSEMKSKWLTFQKDMANNWSSTKGTVHDYDEATNELTQAYRLYTLALAGTPELGAMNRMKEIEHLSNVAKWRLAGAYHLAGQKDIAKKLVVGTSTSVKKYREFSYSFGSDFRDKSMILEMTNLIQPSKSAGLSKDVSEVLSSKNWLSTQETSYGLIAMTSSSAKLSGLQLQVNGENIDSKKPVINKRYSESDWCNKKKISIKNTSANTVYISLTTSKVPRIGKEKKLDKKLKMFVHYTSMNGTKLNPKEMVQGTDFHITVQLTNTTKSLYKELSLSQILPSGWEIMSTNVSDDNSSSTSEYQDIRDDRVYSYFNLNPGQSKTFNIQVNASYLGNFYMPGIYAEAMYDNSVRSQSKGSWVKVLRGGDLLVKKSKKLFNKKK